MLAAGRGRGHRAAVGRPTRGSVRCLSRAKANANPVGVGSTCSHQEQQAYTGNQSYRRFSDSGQNPWTIVRRLDQFLSALITPQWKVLRS